MFVDAGIWLSGKARERKAQHSYFWQKWVLLVFIVTFVFNIQMLSSSQNNFRDRIDLRDVECRPEGGSEAIRMAQANLPKAEDNCIEPNETVIGWEIPSQEVRTKGSQEKAVSYEKRFRIGGNSPSYKPYRRPLATSWTIRHRHWRELRWKRSWSTRTWCGVQRQLRFS
jgi:hypothetical protein